MLSQNGYDSRMNIRTLLLAQQWFTRRAGVISADIPTRIVRQLHGRESNLKYQRVSSTPTLNGLSVDARIIYGPVLRPMDMYTCWGAT